SQPDAANEAARSEHAAAASTRGRSFAGRSERDHVNDKWARSRLHRTVQAVTDALEAYDAFAGSQALEQLVDDLSNWYVRRSRSRFWKSSDPTAHATLHECLTTLTTILAPYCPFLADEM